jgi:hypothetical protein
MFEAPRIAVFDQAAKGFGWSFLLAPLRVKLILFCHLLLPGESKHPLQIPRPPFAKGGGVKKLSPVQRAGRDVVKVLQRYLFTLATDVEKFDNTR